VRRSSHISKQDGFTLVELMSVLVIIGLLTSAVVLTLPNQQPTLRSYGETLVQDLNAASQSGLLTGKSAALGLSDEKAAVMTYETGDWTVIQTYPFPENVSVVYEVDNQKIHLKEDIIPLAMFEPTGLATAFTLSLSDFDTTLVLESVGDGRVVIQPTGS